MPMRNIRMRIEYDGTDYAGWQLQSGTRTVQGVIENALLKMTGTDIRITGASRTDQGVHALGQVANFKMESHLRLDQIQNGVNSMVGDDVQITETAEADIDFNARFSAKSKVYEYRIIRSPSPIQRRYSWHVGYKLDVAAMEKVIPLLLGEHDFLHFSVALAMYRSTNGGAGSENKNTVCTVHDLFLTTKDFDIIITIKADRFLRKMVRGIVGFMVDVGRGRFPSEDALKVFKGEIKEFYFAPPQGLFLMEVIY